MRTDEEVDSRGAVDMSERSNRIDDGVSASEYSAGKLRTLIEVELQTLAEVDEKSIA